MFLDFDQVCSVADTVAFCNTFLSVLMQIKVTYFQKSIKFAACGSGLMGAGFCLAK